MAGRTVFLGQEYRRLTIISGQQVSTIAFQVANAAGGNAIDLTPGETLIKCTDQTQSKMFPTDSSSAWFTSTGLGSADSDMLLQRNEVYEVKMFSLDSTDSGDNNLTNTIRLHQSKVGDVVISSRMVEMLKADEE